MQNDSLLFDLLAQYMLAFTRAMEDSFLINTAKSINQPDSFGQLDSIAQQAKGITIRSHCEAMIMARFLSRVQEYVKHKFGHSKQGNNQVRKYLHKIDSLQAFGSLSTILNALRPEPIDIEGRVETKNFQAVPMEVKSATRRDSINGLEGFDRLRRNLSCLDLDTNFLRDRYFEARNDRIQRTDQLVRALSNRNSEVRVKIQKSEAKEHKFRFRSVRMFTEQKKEAHEIQFSFKQTEQKPLPPYLVRLNDNLKTQESPTKSFEHELFSSIKFQLNQKNSIHSGLSSQSRSIGLNNIGSKGGRPIKMNIIFFNSDSNKELSTASSSQQHQHRATHRSIFAPKRSVRYQRPRFSLAHCKVNSRL